MNVIIHTLNGPETLEGITSINQFDDVIVLADDDGNEYHSLNDFPTMYRMEIEQDG